MALTDKITAIGNAIRSKTGSSDLLTLDEMPQEIQAIQTGGSGDTALVDSILSGTITTYSSDNVVSLRQSALYDCSNLVELNLPNLTTMGTGALGSIGVSEIDFPKLTSVSISGLANSRSLSRAKFAALEEIKTMSLSYTALSELILMNNFVTTLSASNCFNGTPIANGTGYIYVPQALIEDYKVATNWVTFAEQFRAIEDYPEICGEVS